MATSLTEDEVNAINKRNVGLGFLDQVNGPVPMVHRIIFFKLRGENETELANLH